MIVIDTNVLSEMMKLRASAAVVGWLALQVPGEVFTTTITEAEVFYGIQLMPRGKRRDLLFATAELILAEDFPGRILPFDSAAARVYADMAASRRISGKPISHPDAQIASITRVHRATLATRNMKDFADCGIELIDPWRTRP